MRDWRNTKAWSDRFLPEIKRILGEYLISEPPFEEDMERNTDLIVLRLDAVRIACRVRRYEYFQRYGNEFTIRSNRPSGVKTEFTKIIEGWGDYMFYGFADPEEEHLHSWILGDLKAFRIYVSRCFYAKKTPWIEDRKNGDGSSTFKSFRYADISGFLIARGDPPHQSRTPKFVSSQINKPR